MSRPHRIYRAIDYRPVMIYSAYAVDWHARRYIYAVNEREAEHEAAAWFGVSPGEIVLRYQRTAARRWAAELVDRLNAELAAKPGPGGCGGG